MEPIDLAVSIAFIIVSARTGDSPVRLFPICFHRRCIRRRDARAPLDQGRADGRVHAGDGALLEPGRRRCLPFHPHEQSDRDDPYSHPRRGLRNSSNGSRRIQWISLGGLSSPGDRHCRIRAGSAQGASPWSI